MLLPHAACKVVFSWSVPKFFGLFQIYFNYGDDDDDDGDDNDNDGIHYSDNMIELYNYNV